MTRPTPGGGMLVVHDLTLRFEEAQEALTAIRSGDVDALVVSAETDDPKVFLLKGADDAHRVLLETLNEGAMTIAPDATILYANKRLSELVGRPLEKVLGAPLTRFLAPESAGPFAALLSSEKASGKAELYLLSSSGDRVPVMMSLRAVGGDHEMFTVVVTDLTPLKAAQDALEQANDDLEARVLQRTAEIGQVNDALRAEIGERTRLAEELAHKNEELAVADRRKDEFLSMLAHELRNPLSPILTAAEMLRTVGPNGALVERYRSVIERQTKNLARIVDDLLDVSRITRRSITLRRQRVALSSVVSSAVEAARPLIDAGSHVLTVTLPAEDAELRVDPTRFEQVLVNLLNNAAKYTDRGGKIALSAEVVGEEAVIRVADTGVGIPSDLLPHVFDLFVQGKRSLARSQGGLGIGLTLVKNLVDMHGGSVEARSAGAGRGSEFMVRVPLASAEAQSRPSAPEEGRAASTGELPIPVVVSGNAAPREKKEPTSDLPKRRILVVEDNVDAAESLVDLLQYWGFDVSSVGNGEDAVRAASEVWPDAALVDVGLPGMDGYEVARCLRALEKADGRVLLVGITGYGQPRDRSRGADAGFDQYLVKPLNADTLWGVLDNRWSLSK